MKQTTTRERQKFQGIFTQRHVLRCAADRRSDDVSSLMAPARSCLPLAPIPAVWTSLTQPFQDYLVPRSMPWFWVIGDYIAFPVREFHKTLVIVPTETCRSASHHSNLHNFVFEVLINPWLNNVKPKPPFSSAQNCLRLRRKVLSSAKGEEM